MTIIWAIVILGALGIIFGLILAGKAPVTACAPAGPENAAKIAAIMGMEAPSGDKMVAHVLCNGGCNAKDNFEYRGVKDCLAATKVCANSCIACGMCERTCKFDAIHVVDNVAVIDYSKCKNCTMCAKACPRNAIEPIPTPEEKEKFKAAQKAAAEKKAAAAKAAAEAAEAPKAE